MITVLYDQRSTIFNLIQDLKHKLTFKWHHLEQESLRFCIFLDFSMGTALFILFLVETALFIYSVFPYNRNSGFTPSLLICFLQAYSWDILFKQCNK